jgi:hypothetical protein
VVESNLEENTDGGEIESKRARFDQEVINRVFPFGNELLQDVPELEVLAIVPVWGVPQENLLPAIYLTRSGSGMSPHQLMLAMDRFTSASEYKLGRIRELLNATSDMLNKQAGTINDNQEKIQAQEAQIKEYEERLENVKKTAKE